MNLVEMFSYSFMVKALIVGVAISLSAALLGVSLTLRKNSMLSDGLSHVAFGAFAVATVFNMAPIWLAMPVVIIASFAILSLNRNRRVYGDAIIAVMSAASLAIGVLAISVSKGVNIDLNSYLFGSILSVGWSDVWMGVITAAIVALFYVFLHHRIFAITFDEEFAKSIGVNTKIYDGIFAIICSVVVVLGMRLLGALLISSLIIFPTLISMQIFKSFKNVVIAAVLISVVNFVIGLLLSYVIATPTGATVVIVNLLMLILAKVYSVLKK